MPRNLRPHEHQRRTQARRDFALERRDLREPSSPREPAAGATSPAVKKTDPADRAAIDEFLSKWKAD